MAQLEVSKRYAKALFDLLDKSNEQEKAFNELRAFADIIHKDDVTNNFVHSILIKTEDKEKAVGEAIKGKGFSPEVENFLKLLAKKGRLQIFEEILNSYQYYIDSKNGVTRGVVKSSSPLTPEDRTRIEAEVSKATGKKVIFTYKEDPNLIGGLVAEAGGFRFDDSLTSHLTRLKEELNRRTH